MKNKEKIQIEIIKSKIESEKTALDRYVKAIVRSSFIEYCTGGAFFNEMYHDLLKHGLEKIENSKKSDKEKGELRRKLFPLFHEGKTELERWESNLKYQEHLTGWAKYLLNDLNKKDKEKMVRDCIKQQEMWSMQFDKNSKLYDELKEVKVIPKKKKIVTKSKKVNKVQIKKKK